MTDDSGRYGRIFRTISSRKSSKPILIKKMSIDYGIRSSSIETNNNNNNLILPEAVAGAGVLSTFCDVVSSSYTSVFIVNKNKKMSVRKTKPTFIHVHFE